MKDIRQRKRMEKIEYVRSMLGQLRTMVEAERCEILTYLIEMAYVEASDIMRGERQPSVTPIRAAENTQAA